MRKLKTALAIFGAISLATCGGKETTDNKSKTVEPVKVTTNEKIVGNAGDNGSKTSDIVSRAYNENAILAKVLIAQDASTAAKIVKLYPSLGKEKANWQRNLKAAKSSITFYQHWQEDVHNYEADYKKSKLETTKRLAVATQTYGPALAQYYPLYAEKIQATLAALEIYRRTGSDFIDAGANATDKIRFDAVKKASGDYFRNRNATQAYYRQYIADQDLAVVEALEKDVEALKR